VSAAL